MSNNDSHRGLSLGLPAWNRLLSDVHMAGLFGSSRTNCRCPQGRHTDTQTDHNSSHTELFWFLHPLPLCCLSANGCQHPEGETVPLLPSTLSSASGQHRRACSLLQEAGKNQGRFPGETTSAKLQGGQNGQTFRREDAVAGGLRSRGMGSRGPRQVRHRLVNLAQDCGSLDPSRPSEKGPRDAGGKVKGMKMEAWGEARERTELGGSGGGKRSWNLISDGEQGREEVRSGGLGAQCNYLDCKTGVSMLTPPHKSR